MRARRLVDAACNLVENFVGQLGFLGQLDALCLQGVAKLPHFGSGSKWGSFAGVAL
ncbi:MAG: hypothetical protein IJ087_10295 [Eggerthellaceae bacterium]|nr:hypothetical protein [Eggerthellaceae bacterium]